MAPVRGGCAVEYAYCVETDQTDRTFETLAAAEYRLYRSVHGGGIALAAAAAAFACSLLWSGVDSLAATWMLRALFAAFAAVLTIPLRWLREMHIRDGLAQTYAAQPLCTDGAEYAFFDTHFLVWSACGTRIVYYDAITDLVETDEFFLIFLEGTASYALCKWDFTHGDPQTFCSFLAAASACPWEKMAV